jgi:hypothetical protein
MVRGRPPVRIGDALLMLAEANLADAVRTGDPALIARWSRTVAALAARERAA